MMLPRQSGIRWLCGAALLCAGCNVIFGLDEPLPFPDKDGLGGDGAASTGAGGAQSSSATTTSETTSSSGTSTTTSSTAIGGSGHGGTGMGGSAAGGAPNGGAGGSSSSSSSTSSSSTSSSSTSSSSSTGGPTTCDQQPADPVTGQKCPLFAPCKQYSDCGGANNYGITWACLSSKCDLSAQSGNWQEVFDGCSADVVVRQRTMPPVDKKFLAPDNVDFRQVATLAITVYNYTADDLYLDYIPIQLELQGNASKFDIAGAKLYEDSGGSEYQTGDMFVGISSGIPSNNEIGPYGSSSFSKVPKLGGSEKFVIVLAWAKEKTYIYDRSYRLNIVSSQGWKLRVGSTGGPQFGGSLCGVGNPNQFKGAWLTAVKP